jgi:serine/threonine protein kinase
VEALFEQLIEDGAEPAAILAGEPDGEVAAAAHQLWKNHHRATEKGFLDECITMVREAISSGAPCFSPGQILAGRFTVDRMLGAGGMGEVYLARDGRLEERVAIKTIRRDLAPDPEIRRRFLAEVQNARHVTHPNVCRIFDLFEEGGAPFFAMEYLDGERLSTWLDGTGLRQPARVRRRIALQIAEGLAAAHGKGIIHCDFKPANVILTGGGGAEASAHITDFGLARALAEPAGSLASHSLAGGTGRYMAPELSAGESPTIRTDIYAYGKVLEELLPGHRQAAHCQAARPSDRPASLTPVIRDLRGDFSRRKWIGAGVATVASAVAALELRPSPRRSPGWQRRIVLNGFRPAEGGRASLLRELLMTALRESPLLSVMADDRLRAVLHDLRGSRALPADHALLAAAATRESALMVEGLVDAADRGVRLLLQVFEPSGDKPALKVAEQADDPRQLTRLADRIALRLRRELGESESSLAASYTPLEQVTSGSPEAVEFYFRGIQEYEAARAESAIELFDQALRLDPEFGLAHLHRGIALIANHRTQDAVPNYKTAFALRERLTERERLSVESRYYIFITDFDSSFKVSHRLVTLFPEEATFQRAAAFAAVRLGRTHNALEYNDRAVALDPDSANNLSEWMVNRCAAGQADEALALFARCREEGNNAPTLEYGAGNAYLLKEDYENARRAFERLGRSAESDRWSKLLVCAPLILQGRFRDAAERLRADLAYDTATGEQMHTQSRRLWLGMVEWLMDSPGAARKEAVALAAVQSPPTGWIDIVRQNGMLAHFLGEPVLADSMLERLREFERDWPSTHTQGARAHLEAVLTGGQDPGRSGNLLLTATGLWPDCLTLYSMAEWQIAHGEFAAALATLDSFEEQRGNILRLYFPGMLVLGRILRARCLSGLSRNSEAVRLYQWVLDRWGAGEDSFHIIQDVRKQHDKLIAISGKEKRR